MATHAKGPKNDPNRSNNKLIVISAYARKRGWLVRQNGAGNSMVIQSYYSVRELAQMEKVWEARKSRSKKRAVIEEIAILRKKALEAGREVKRVGGPRRFLTTTIRIERDPRIRSYVIARAKGRCEGCGRRVTDLNVQGKPLLESHHFEKGGIAKGGRDIMFAVAALDGHCHNIGDRGANSRQFNAQLSKKIRLTEKRYVALSIR